MYKEESHKKLIAIISSFSIYVFTLRCISTAYLYLTRSSLLKTFWKSEDSSNNIAFRSEKCYYDYVRWNDGGILSVRVEGGGVHGASMQMSSLGNLLNFSSRKFSVFPLESLCKVSRLLIMY